MVALISAVVDRGGDKVVEETFRSKIQKFGWLTKWGDERERESRMTPKILAY